MLLPEARLLLSSQPDFKNQKNWIEETCNKLGHLAIFGAKFHPELAAIEYFWGECKKYARRHCDYTLVNLRKVVPEALLSVSLYTIRRHFMHVKRYMKAYESDTLSNQQIEWAMRKYSSHRRAKEPPTTLEEDFLTEIFFLDCPFKE